MLDLPPSPKRRRRRATRRGAHTVEFALVLPIFLTVLASIFEYGWVFFIKNMTASAVRRGCRVGAITDPDDTPGPEAAATAEIETLLSKWSFGSACGDADDSSCEVSVTATGADPSESLVCTSTITYGGLTGAIPVPSPIVSTTMSRLEVQR